MTSPAKPCRHCQSMKHFPSQCPDRAKGTAPAGGGEAKPEAKVPRATHKKRKVKTRAVVSLNGGASVVVEHVRELVKRIESGRAAELELAEVRKALEA